MAKQKDLGITKDFVKYMWDAYDDVDTRRQKNTLLLFLVCIIVFILLFIKADAEKLTFEILYTGTEVVEYFIALFISFIVLLSVIVSNHYLCCHSVRAFLRWTFEFEEAYRSDLEISGMSYEGVCETFKRRDITEVFNPYHLMARRVRWKVLARAENWIRVILSSDGHGGRMTSIFQLMQYSVANTLALISASVPIVLCMLLAYRLFNNFDENINVALFGAAKYLIVFAAVLPLSTLLFFHAKLRKLMKEYKFCIDGDSAPIKGLINLHSTAREKDDVDA